jgi:hypothetical protein
MYCGFFRDDSLFCGQVGRKIRRHTFCVVTTSGNGGTPKIIAPIVRRSSSGLPLRERESPSDVGYGRATHRPVYHRKEERIRAHVMLCWLALLLIRVVENQTGRTWREVRNLFRRLHLVEYQSPDGHVQQSTELTDEQMDIVSALQITKPQRIWGISPH